MAYRKKALYMPEFVKMMVQNRTRTVGTRARATDSK